MKSIPTTLSYEKLSSLYNYDPETGIVRRKVTCKGAVAGKIITSGRVCIKGVRVRVTKLAWLLHTKERVSGRIHFYDGDSTNIRFKNLYCSPLPEKPITQRRLKKLLKYDPEIGTFTRRVGGSGTKGANSTAGCLTSRGYVQIRINEISYLAHRLAWLYVHGYFPENEIDHINRVRNDNRLCNLREVSRSCNVRNSGIAVNNTTGVTGVRWNKQRQKWIPTMSLNNTSKYLGRFIDFTEAVAHRYAAEQCLDWGDCDTQSSAREYLIRENIICPA